MEEVLAALRDGPPNEPSELYATVRKSVSGPRVELFSDSADFFALGPLVVEVMRRGLLRRAVVALDFDEYGAEHIVLDGRGGVPRRTHHVYVYPRQENGELYMEGQPTLTDVPAAVTPAADPCPGAVVDGPAAHAATAELYEVPVERMTEAAGAAADGHERLQTVGAPFAPWLRALGIRWLDGRPGRRRRLRPGPVWGRR